MSASSHSNDQGQQAGDRDQHTTPALRLYIGANLRLKSELENWRLDLYRLVRRAAQDL